MVMPVRSAEQLAAGKSYSAQPYFDGHDGPVTMDPPLRNLVPDDSILEQVEY